jgi:N6-adenosine-specific RNA methylase IME4
MFNTVVIDPPWPITMAGKIEGRRSRPRALPYETMTCTQIGALPIAPLLNPGAHVYLWATNKTLREAFEIMESWGVRFHQVLVMHKPSGMAPSLGYVFGTEFCLLGINGRPMQKFKHTGTLNHFSRPSVRGGHSSKPDSFYAMVEKMSPAPYADLFARKERPGWSVWGDEVTSSFEMPGVLA